MIVFMQSSLRGSSNWNFISFDEFARRKRQEKNNENQIKLAKHFPKNRLNKERNQLTYEEICDYFFCGCDKVYACRQSLQIHIRKVHGGIRPDGTIETSEEKEQFLENRESLERTKYDNPLFQHLPIKQHNLLSDLYKPKRSPLFRRIGEQIEGQSTLENVQHPIFKDNISRTQQNVCAKLPYLTSIDMSMTLYLCNLSHHVKPSFLLKTGEMLLITRHAINKHLLTLSLNFVNNGLYRSTKQVQLNSQLTKQYSQKTNSEYVPLIVNHLLEKLLPRWKMDINPKLLSYILEDFCVWLYDNGLTHLRLAPLTPQK